MLGFSIIGTPNGFQISSININRQLSLEGLVDLDNTLINIFPATDILMVTREIGKDYYRHYFVYYRFATEINNTRPGTYYGSVVTIQDRIASPASSLMAALTDLADVVGQQCLTQDSRFHRNITGLEFELPDSVRKLTDNLEKTQLFDGQYDKSGFFPIGDGQDITSYNQFIFNVFKNPLLSEFRVLYASRHREVLNHVREKNALKILNFSKLEEIRAQEITIQQQQEQAKIIEQKRKEEEAKLQKELQEKEAASLRQIRRLPTQKELPAKFINLEIRVEDLERRIKSLSNPKTNSFYKLLEKVNSISWTTFLILVFSLFLITVLLFWYFSSSSKDTESSKGNNVNSKQIASQAFPSVKPTAETLSSTKTSITPSTNSEEKLQLNYQGQLPDVKKVGDLVKLIKSKCNTSCPDTEDSIAESILKINKSINRKDPTINKNTVLDFELKDITGTITFEVSGCCDLSKTAPEIIKLNPRNQ